MSESDSVKKKKSDFGLVTGRIIFAALFAVALVLVFRNLDKFWNVLLVALGFGAVIMIHEFGHFIVAKMSGIKVEAFSIGFSPILVGIRKLEKGVQLRILPTLFKAETTENEDSETEDGLILNLGQGTEPSETEYRIGMVPFGGFVKMLGQEDTGAAEATDDPRSFTNKPISSRIAVVAAGVTFNAISALLIFMTVFLVGMDLSPALVGGVQLDSPADKAGIVAGDRIIEVNGEKFVNFENVVLAPALSSTGEEINFVVEHADGTTEPINVVASQPAMAAMKIRTIGIERASLLTIERGVKDEESIKQMEELFGVRPGDVAKTVNGENVDTYWDLQDKIENLLLPEAVISFERQGASEPVDVEVPLYWPARRNNFAEEFDLAHVCGIIPRIRIMAVAAKAKPKVLRDKIKSIFAKEDKADEVDAPKLQDDDIIVMIGEVENPTYTELREVTTSYDNKEMPITVLRISEDGTEELVTVMVTPEKGTRSERVMFGVVPALDVDHTVVAGTVDIEDGPSALAIPRGAAITAVDGQEVSSYYDIVQVIRANLGQRIPVVYTLNGQNGIVEISLPAQTDYITAVSEPEIILPFEFLKETYKADSAGQAFVWGIKKTYMFIAQTYVTLQRLITREVSPQALSGPVGIVTMSYKIASQSFAEYIYFLGLISSCIAVMNLLPLPIVDGGVIVLLIIEKIKGSPINMKVQEVISYAGLAFLGFVFIWLTYNDILNLFL